MTALLALLLLPLLQPGQEPGAAEKPGTSRPAPLRLLLVTPDPPGRGERIGRFLAGHGFALERVAYGKATRAACDRADLVIADSPAGDKAAFRRTMKLRGRARAFPRTAAPILAVGYLGTELLEAQGLAMASGYI